MVPTYNYTPLPTANSIRLFTLEPGSGSDTIKGNMTSTLLSGRSAATAEFKALSYTWANPLDLGNLDYRPYDVFDHFISCDGATKEVTENLHHALWQLRELKESSPLWIDAVCINQKDTDEKKHQLKLMSRIYSDASWAIIWLGKEDSTTYEAIQAIEKHRESATIYLMPRPSHALSLFISGREWHAVVNLLLRAWFNRLWTLQEVLLPARTMSLCGFREVDISLMAIFAGMIPGKGDGYRN